MLMTSASILASAAGSVLASEPPSFDRPGIGFGSDALAAGTAAWEQGLPDVVVDRRDGVQSSQYTADSLLRLGVGHGVELQLGADSYNWRHSGGERQHGGGDASIGLKYALPSRNQDFGWAVLATYTMPTGASPFGGEGYSRALGVSAAWALNDGRGVALYANYQRDDDGHVWTFSPNYTFYSDTCLAAYVEAGISTGTDDSRVAGAGLTWLVHERVQLDLSFLRGLTSVSPDWQGGFGISFAFD